MHNPGGSGLYLPFNSGSWIFASLVTGFGLWHATKTQQIQSSPLLLLWGGAGLLLFAPLVWNNTLSEHALPRLGSFFAGILFLFSLKQVLTRRQRLSLILNLVMGGIAIEATLGLIEYFLLKPQNWIGYNTLINRPYGIFQQPNVMASLMATGLALALWLETQQETLGSRWRGGLQRYLLVSASLLLVVLQSRVGQLGALLALLLLLPKLKEQSKLALLGWVGLGLALGLVAFFGVGGTKRGSEIYQEGGKRLIYWNYSWQLFLEKPLTGWGYGAFEPTFLNHYMQDKAANPLMPAIEYNLDHPHNELLYWAVEGGIVPLVALLSIIAALLWRVSRYRRNDALAMLALLLPIALHTQTEYPFYHSITHYFIWLLLVQVVDSWDHGFTRSTPYKETLLLRFSALLIPLLVVPFMVTALHTTWLVGKFERSGFRQPQLMMQLINPLAWFERVEFDLNQFRFAAGLAIKSEKELNAYVGWAKEFTAHTPRSTVYANAVRALDALGRHDEAEALWLQAKILYPDVEAVLNARSLPSKTNLTPKNAAIATDKLTPSAASGSNSL